MAESSLAENFRSFMGGDMKREIDERVDRLLAHEPLAGSDYDTFGSSRDTIKAIMPKVCFLSRCYFRTETHGLEKVAAMKRALIIPNHMSPAPVDGVNICAEFFLKPEQPRMVRSVVHYLLANIPFMNMLVSRSGQIVGHPDNVQRIFSEDNIILLFPEGAGAFRLFKNRYRLSKFNIGFLEMAIKYDYPIIPTAVIGSEESIMILAEVKALRNKLGFVNFPITPTFPLLGIPGLFPMPVKFRIYFGEPMDFSQHKDKLEHPEEIEKLVAQVKQRVQDMLDERRAELPKYPFF